ncbi:MAG: hypothetical protein ABIG29_01665 [Candidatus Nealsonbacteria bacterium]
MEEDKAYADLLAAEEKVGKILADIDLVIQSAKNRGCGEKLAMELYSARMDAAMKESRIAFDKWMQETRGLMKEIEVSL